MAYVFTNNAYSTLAVALVNDGTTLQVQPGTGDRFPVVAAPDFTYLTLEDAAGNREIIKVTARTDDVMTIVRGQEGTLAIPFPANSRLELRVTAENIDINNQDVLLL